MNPESAVSELGRSTITKVTRRLIPFLALLYFINYLDRVNIGFAGPNGMNAELGLSATMFGFASGIFFFGYLFLEVPSNIALHRFGARRWLARIMLTWGMVSTAIAFVPNAHTLVVLRFLLGVTEAGFFPGIILYLTLWFPAKQRAWAVSLFMVAVPVSTAVGSTLSALVIDWGHGVLGLAGWRFMFLVEGLPAVALAIACWFYLTDRPAQARWLDADERQWLQSTLEAERATAEGAAHWPLRKALTHPRMLALAFIYFGIVYGLYAVGFFLPTIVAGFQQQYGSHLGIIGRGLVTAIPYAIAAIVMVFWARHADRTGERVWHVAIPAIIGGVSTPAALYMANPYLAMVAITLTTCSIMCAMPVFWALPSTFLTGAAAAGGIALINSLGNISGFGGPYVTGWLNDLTGGPHASLWVVGGFSLASAAVVILLGAAPATTRSAGPETFSRTR
ncbi:MFS transporter [Mycolicibacter arupensis]|uniref:Putative tartrate transporter n=1 Tax=Mycolicibacter arupensis TaxID=342002 RepID=A0A0F5MWF7_9MYCO|nr:MFS transporter [Mycolicibacter arupensis]KKB98934.1 MFS transporter [Mycolicibacter arupensis]MCV7277226.1 MFS transporter [Mycolicibacter arupensis]OQZ98158.1 MFS transporter [Mycolicibacter arupensis]